MSDKNHEPVNRPTRRPLHAQNKLSFEARPGYYRRIVNDAPGRIQKFLDAGYTVVQDDSTVINEASTGQAGLGSAVKRHVGGGQYGVLMEIPLEFYKEDQEAKEVLLRRKEADIKPSEGGFYGEGLQTS